MVSLDNACYTCMSALETLRVETLYKPLPLPFTFLPRHLNISIQVPSAFCDPVSKTFLNVALNATFRKVFVVDLERFCRGF